MKIKRIALKTLRDCKMAPVTSQMLALATFSLAVWPSGRSNFDLRSFPLGSTEKFIRSEHVTLGAVFQFFFFQLFWRPYKYLGKHQNILGSPCSHIHDEQVCQVSCRYSKQFQTLINTCEIDWSFRFFLSKFRITILYRNTLPASNFGGTFDQFLLSIFYVAVAQDTSLL